MSGAMARAAQLDAISDNLANIESPGFKGTRPAFNAFMAPGRGTDKVLTAAVATTIDMRPGTMETTDNPTDVVPSGDLMLGVTTQGGKVAYTRNGHIEVGSDGVLQIAGMPVLGVGGSAIVIPENTEVMVDSTGEVMAGREEVGKLALFSVLGSVDRVGPSLMIPSAGATVSEISDGTLDVGVLEKGNVTALESTVAMIGAQRHYEMAIQAIQAYRQLDQRAVEVGRVR
jgi:flagellar basal-body rod protein FlgF